MPLSQGLGRTSMTEKTAIVMSMDIANRKTLGKCEQPGHVGTGVNERMIPLPDEHACDPAVRVLTDRRFSGAQI